MVKNTLNTKKNNLDRRYRIDDQGDDFDTTGKWRGSSCGRWSEQNYVFRTSRRLVRDVSRRESESKETVVVDRVTGYQLLFPRFSARTCSQYLTSGTKASEQCSTVSFDEYNR